MKEASADNTEPPFSLELVAMVAAVLLVGNPKGAVSANGREQAADEAVRLLAACKDRLAKHWEIAKREQPIPDSSEAESRIRAAEVKFVKEKFGDPAPFKKGIIHITGQATEADALAWFRSWQRHVPKNENQSESDLVSQKELIEAHIIKELKFRREKGYPSGRLVQIQKEFAAWKKKYPREGPGKKIRKIVAGCKSGPENGISMNF